MKVGTLLATCCIIVVSCASVSLYGDVIFNSLGPNGEYVENISFGSANGIIDPIITSDVDYAARFVVDQGELYNDIFITVPFSRVDLFFGSVPFGAYNVVLQAGDNVEVSDEFADPGRLGPGTVLGTWTGFDIADLSNNPSDGNLTTFDLDGVELGAGEYYFRVEMLNSTDAPGIHGWQGSINPTPSNGGHAFIENGQWFVLNDSPSVGINAPAMLVEGTLVPAPMTAMLFAPASFMILSRRRKRYGY